MLSSQEGRFTLGIDPGSKVTGWAVLSGCRYKPRVIDCGVIKPSGKLLSERLSYLQKAFVELAELFPLNIVGVETQYTGINIRSSLVVSMVKGVVLAVLKTRYPQIMCLGVSPTQAKKALVGQGSADKKQVKLQAERIFSLEDLPLDCADALAIAYFSHGLSCATNMQHL